jgi:putative acetyltransferase
MLIRPETAADRAGIRDVVQQAFERAAEADLVDALRDDPDFLGDLSLVAIDEQAGHANIVGHLLFSPIVIGATAGLALAPLSVMPHCQRQGIGVALTTAGLERAASAGHKIVVVVGHPEYYPRFGFVPARAHGLEAPFPVSDAAFMVRELTPGALEGVSGMIRYAQAFSRV